MNAEAMRQILIYDISVTLNAGDCSIDLMRYAAGKVSRELAGFSWNELCFTLDRLYGLITSAIKYQ